MTAPDDDAPASFNRRRLLVLGGFALTTAAVAATLDSSSDTPTTTGGEAGSKARVKVKGEPAPESPAQPGAIGDATAPPADHVFDRVLRNGRVMDPETGYDRVADVGIDGEQVTAISETPLTGRATVDATGLVVAPGFIDVLSYEPNDLGSWFKIADGVTSNLCMHGINDTAGNFFARYGTAEPVPPVHYGGAFDNPYERSVVLRLPKGTAEGAQLDRLVAAFDEGVRGGWMGLDVEPEYTPWVQTSEFMALAQVAAKYKVPMFWHMRYSDPDDPGTSMEAIDEMLAVARETGVAVHIAHITSMATHVMDEAIAKVNDARAAGVDITACMYPYDFWATTLGSERFSPGWQDRFRISYNDLEVPGTGERLTAATFASYQRQNKLVAAHAIPEADVQAGLRAEWVMMGSDAIIEPNAGGKPNNHPRAAGTFSRTLGRYVRDEQVLSLMDALAKMTILSARRLEGRVPALQRKGRLQLGADADLTLFDPATVADRSTIADPAQESAGIAWVFVRGQAVKTPDGIDRTVRPGLGLKSEV